MSSDLQLTLGALYREMRAGLGDTGRVRVTVEFLQRTIAVAGEAETAEPASLVLETLLEYEDRVLDRAQIALRGSGGPPLRFMVARHGDAYAYSLDGGVRWGRVAAHPRIFSLEEFERELAEIPVEDATYDVLDAVRAGEPPRYRSRTRAAALRPYRNASSTPSTSASTGAPSCACSTSSPRTSTTIPTHLSSTPSR